MTCLKYIFELYVVKEEENTNQEKYLGEDQGGIFIAKIITVNCSDQ